MTLKAAFFILHISAAQVGLTNRSPRTVSVQITGNAEARVERHKFQDVSAIQLSESLQNDTGPRIQGEEGNLSFTSSSKMAEHLVTSAWNHTGITTAIGNLVSRVKGALQSALNAAQQALNAAKDIVQTAVNATQSFITSTITSAILALTPTNLIKYIMRSNVVTNALQRFIENSVFLELMLFESEILTALTCGMRFDTTVVGKTAGAFVKRIDCKLKCQQRLAETIGLWLTAPDPPVYSVLGSFGEIGVWVVKHLTDMQQMMEDQTFRQTLLWELGVSPGLRKALTPTRWNRLLGGKGHGSASLLIIPDYMAGVTVKAKVAQVAWKSPNPDFDVWSGFEQYELPQWSEGIASFIDNLVNQLGAEAIITYILGSLSSQIVSVFLDEARKDFSDVLHDNAFHHLLTALFENVKFSAVATRLKAPLPIWLDELYSDLTWWRAKWASMHCARQVAKSHKKQQL